MQAVALTTRKHSAKFLLIGSREIETAEVSTRVDIPVAQTDQLVSTADYLINRFFRVNILMLLVYVCQFHGLSYLESTFVYGFQSHNQAEQGSLAGTVRTDYTDNAVRGQHEIQVIEQQLVTVSFRHSFGLNHLVAQTGTVRNKDFQFLFLFLHILVQQLVIGVQTGLSFRLTGFGSHAHPVQLAFQGLAAFACHFLFHLHTFGLLFQPAGVISLPGDSFATVQFQNPSGYVVQEVTVVGYGNHRTFILLQMLFQPVDTFRVQVVGRLVQQQDIRLLQQQAAQGHTAALTSREVLHRLVFGRTAQRIHGAFQFAVQIPCVRSVNDVLQLSLTGKECIHLLWVLIVFGKPELVVYFFVFRQSVHNALHTFHHYLFHCLFIIQMRFLCQIAYRVARREHHFSLITFLQSGDDFHQR